MINFNSFHGIVTMITDLVGQNGEGDGCNKLISLENALGATVNFEVSPTTLEIYVTSVSHQMFTKHCPPVINLQTFRIPEKKQEYQRL